MNLHEYHNEWLSYWLAYGVAGKSLEAASHILAGKPVDSLSQLNFLACDVVLRNY